MKTVKYLLGAALLLLLFVGCGGGSKDIVVWIPGDEVEYGFYFDALESYKNLSAEDGKKFNYVIEQQPWSDYWVKLPLEVNNGRGPDLFLTHWAYDTNLRGISRELDLTQAEKDMFHYVDMYPGASGEPVYIPTTFVSKVMYVNRDLAPNFKVENAVTWEGLKEELEKLVPGSGSADALDQGIIPFQYSFHMLYDLRYAEGKMFTDAAGVAELDDTGFEFLKSLEEAGLTQYLERDGADAELNNGTAAVVYGEPWMEFWASDQVKDSIEAFPVPGPVTTQALELSFGINKNVDDERFAELHGFAKYMLMDEEVNASIVSGSSGTPNLKGLNVEYDAGSAGYANTNSHHAVLLIPPQAFEEVLGNMLGDWEGLGGTKNAQQTVDDANRAAEKLDLSFMKTMEDYFRDEL